jgi:transposase InsO family protein
MRGLIGRQPVFHRAPPARHRVASSRRFDICGLRAEKTRRPAGVPDNMTGQAKYLHGVFLASRASQTRESENPSFNAKISYLSERGRLYVCTRAGLVYVAFVMDAYVRRIVGWRVNRTAHASFVLDALEQALHERQPMCGDGLIHHSHGSQYVSIRYTERLAEAGIEPSVGSVGDSYDNALAETINGLYKAEVIHRRGPWRSFEAVEFTTLEWVDWFNHRRLLEPIGNIPPAEAEAHRYAMLEEPALAGDSNETASDKPDTVEGDTVIRLRVIRLRVCFIAECE